MGRPRKENPQELAPAKIEEAFFHLLEEEGYTNITVTRLSQEAGTNRNSFYYHYQDIEDLARRAFLHNAEAADTGTFLTTLLSFRNAGRDIAGTASPHVVERAKRIMLYAGSDSAFLTRMVYDLLKKIWLSELSIREERLSPAEKLQIHFIFSGLVAALGSKEVRESPRLMASLAGTDLGAAAIAALKSIAHAQACV